MMAAAAGVEIAGVGAFNQPSQRHGDDVSAISGVACSSWGLRHQPIKRARDNKGNKVV